MIITSNPVVFTPATNHKNTTMTGLGNRNKKKTDNCDKLCSVITWQLSANTWHPGILSDMYLLEIFYSGVWTNYKNRPLRHHSILIGDLSSGSLTTHGQARWELDICIIFPSYNKEWYRHFWNGQARWNV